MNIMFIQVNFTSIKINRNYEIKVAHSTYLYFNKHIGNMTVSYIVGKHTNKTIITLNKKNRKICINFALDYTVGVTNINNVHYSLLNL